MGSASICNPTVQVLPSSTVGFHLKVLGFSLGIRFSWFSEDVCPLTYFIISQLQEKSLKLKNKNAL